MWRLAYQSNLVEKYSRVRLAVLARYFINSNNQSIKRAVGFVRMCAQREREKQLWSLTG